MQSGPTSNWWELIPNAFCPTGKGGGVDPTSVRVAVKDKSTSNQEQPTFNELSLLTSNISGKVRRETLDGRDYLVVPMRMLKEGVLNGSKGPLFYPQSEIARGSDAWNNMPIVVNHPTKDGKACSARSPKILEQYGVGTVFNTVVGGPLDAEAWFDYKKAQKLIPNELAKAERGEPIELSTGLFTDNQPVKNDDKATYNGKKYTHIARNYRPDHLAILPDKKGACSNKDGCGVNVVNEEEVTNAKVMTTIDHGHSHEALVDANGNGETTEDNGHRHEIKKGEVLEADGHAHDVVTPTGNEDSPTINPFVSEEQRRYMWAKHPQIAKKWAHGKHSSKGKDHKMPKKTGENVKGPMAEAEREKQRGKELATNEDLDPYLDFDVLENAASHNDIRDALQTALVEMKPPESYTSDKSVPMAMPYVVDVFDKQFVFQCHEGKLHKLGYSVDKRTGKVEISNEAPELVRRTVDYQPVGNSDFYEPVESWYELVGNEEGCASCGETCDCTDCTEKHGKKTEPEVAENEEWVEELIINQTSNTEITMNKTQKIAELIANSDVWDETDEKALNAMPDKKLGAIYNQHVELVEAYELIENMDGKAGMKDAEYEDMDDEEEGKKKPKKGKVPPQFLKNEATHAALASNDNANRRLTAEEQADIQWARTQRQAIRNELIESITANEASDFTDEYLASRSLEELQGLAKLATANAKKESKPTQDMRVLRYDGAGGALPAGPQLTENFSKEDADMAPPIIDYRSA